MRQTGKIAHTAGRSEMEQTYRKENDILRGVGRRLSPLRDAQAMVEILDDLKEKCHKDLGTGNLAAIRKALLDRKKQIKKRFEEKHEADELVRVLQEVDRRITKWPLKKADPGTISTALANTIKRGAKASKEARKSGNAQSYHHWRKRAKDLRYHLALLENTWKPVMGGFLDSATDLETHLGDDHNLTVFRNLLLKSPKQFGSRQKLSNLLKVLSDRQQRLRLEDEPLAERIYSDKPGKWERRIKQYWHAHRIEKKQEKDKAA